MNSFLFEKSFLEVPTSELSLGLGQSNSFLISDRLSEFLLFWANWTVFWSWIDLVNSLSLFWADWTVSWSWINWVNFLLFWADWTTFWSSDRLSKFLILNLAFWENKVLAHFEQIRFLVGVPYELVFWEASCLFLIWSSVYVMNHCFEEWACCLTFCLNEFDPLIFQSRCSIGSKERASL